MRLILNESLCVYFDQRRRIKNSTLLQHIKLQFNLNFRELSPIRVLMKYNLLIRFINEVPSKQKITINK